MSRKPIRPLEEARTFSADRDDDVEYDEAAGIGSEFIRRMAAVGLSSFFTTESAIRRAFGDTVPKEWIDFASDQSERTRSEVIDRMAQEVGKQLAETDLAELFSRFLSGHTVEINAKVRLTPRDDDDPTSGLRAHVEFEDE